MAVHLPMEHQKQALSLIFSLITLLFPAKLQTPVSCTAGRYTEGTTAYIICHFPAGVQITPQQGVYVEKNKNTEVLKCQSSKQAVICDIATGFYFNKDFRDNLTLLIPEVTHHFEGSYFCQLFPLTDGTTPLTCKLTIDDIVTVSTEGSVAKPADNSDQPYPEKDDRPEANLPFLIFLTAFGSSSATVAIVLTIQKFRKRGSTDSPPTGTQNESMGFLRGSADEPRQMNIIADNVTIHASVDMLASPTTTSVE